MLRSETPAIRRPERARAVVREQCADHSAEQAGKGGIGEGQPGSAMAVACKSLSLSIWATAAPPQRKLLLHGRRSVRGGLLRLAFGSLCLT